MPNMTDALKRAATETTPLRAHKGRENDQRAQPDPHARDWATAFARAQRQTA